MRLREGGVAGEEQGVPRVAADGIGDAAATIASQAKKAA